MSVCGVWSSAAIAARAEAVFPEPTSPVMTPRARSRAHQVMRATASARARIGWKLSRTYPAILGVSQLW